MCIIAIVVDHDVASSISVVLVDIVVEIALANWLALALILLCCCGDKTMTWDSNRASIL